MTSEVAVVAGGTAAEAEVGEFHLRGNYAPQRQERLITDLAVTGTLPAGLSGTFLRNGPNPAAGDSAHWFLGDGMLHGLRFVDGRAAWYRNRWVRTTTLVDGAEMFGSDGARDYRASRANTSVVAHAGRLLALEEASWPYLVTPELATVGPWDFDGRLTTAMTAHPKVCPDSGEMHFFGYGFLPPYLTYHVAGATGALVLSREVAVPGPTMMHDFNVTEHWVVFMDLPVVFDLELAMAGQMPYRFDPGYGARLGVLSRHDPYGPVRWFEVEPCFVFHPLNAHDDGATITVDVVRYPRLWADDGTDTPPGLWRWTIDTVTGVVSEAALDDRPCELPRVDDRQVGRRARRGWVSSIPSPDDRAGAGALTVFDLEAATSVTRHLGPGRVPGEAVLVPADDRPGGPGWLLCYVYDAATDRSELLVLDVDDPTGDPVATVALPVRVPFGFHGTWLPDV